MIDLSKAVWRKSARSALGENCVEVASNIRRVVAVRDSKNPAGPALVFTPGQWRTFTSAVKGGEFEI